MIPERPTSSKSKVDSSIHSISAIINDDELLRIRKEKKTGLTSPNEFEVEGEVGEVDKSVGSFPSY